MVKSILSPSAFSTWTRCFWPKANIHHLLEGLGTLLPQRFAVSLDQTHWTLMGATPPSNKSCVIAPLCLPLTQGSGLKLCSTLESSKQLLKCQQLGCLQTGWIRISGVRPRLHSVVYKVPRWFECFPKTLGQNIQLWGFPKSSFLALVLLQLIPSFPETLRHSSSDQSSHLRAHVLVYVPSTPEFQSQKGSQSPFDLKASLNEWATWGSGEEIQGVWYMCRSLGDFLF